MPAYYLAPSLVQLRSEVNARWPGRDKASDGWIGDTSHAARKSDHNPSPPVTGVVRAIDVDKDGIDPMLLVAAACADPRTNYVIFNRRIYTRSYGFKPATYTGANPHDKHVHISIRHGVTYERDTSPWLGATVPVSRPVANTGGSIPTTTGTLPDPLTPEDDMPYTPDELEGIILGALAKRDVEMTTRATPYGRQAAEAAAGWARTLTHRLVTGAAARATPTDRQIGNAVNAIITGDPVDLTGAVTDEDLARIAAWVNDESDRRARARANVTP